jgi:putative ABC transport system permease protein
MGWMRFFRRSQLDRDRAGELESYLQIATDEYASRGLSPDEARRAARLKLGNATRIREEILQLNTIRVLDSLSRDLRYAVRGMRRHPTFTLAVVLTLALGLGASTAIFAVVNGVLIKPLPYPDAGQLVSLRHTAPGINVDDLRLSPTQYFTYRDEGRVFQHLGIYSDGGTTVTGIGDAEQARALFASDGVLQALGVQPALGRFFTAEETTGARPGASTGGRAVILTYGYWQRRFGGDPSAVGKTLQVDSQQAVIVGVMPKGFRFLDMKPQAELIVPIQLNRSGLTLDGFPFRALARLKPGTTVAEANADIVRMLPIWQHAWPPSPSLHLDASWRIAPTLRPLKADVIGTAGDMLWILMGTIGIVLLIACANVANLMLVRSDSRSHELALRAALGAGRVRIARELLTESLVLALVGGALGALLAEAAVRALVATAPTTLPRLADISLDPVVIAFALTISILSSLLFGLVAAVKAGTPVVAGTRGVSASPERQRTRNALVVVQVALAVVLLISSGLMIRTFQSLRRVRPGFADVGRLQTARVWFPPQRVGDPERVIRIQQELLEKITALPGVRAAGFASGMPMEAGRAATMQIFVEGQVYANGIPPIRRIKSVSPGYFGAVGTRLVAGRDITWSDIDARAPVAIVSENFAREIFGSALASLGRRIHEPRPGGPGWRDIVGVVEDVHEDGLDVPAPAIVYFPAFMNDFLGAPRFVNRAINIAVRSDAAGSENLISAMRRAVSSVNTNLPVFLTRTMKDLYDDSMARTSFALVMLAIASAMAFGLGIIGVYGVLSYVIAQRTREIGIRLALGAEPRRVLGMFVRQGVILSAIGIVAGLAGAIGVMRFMTSLLFGISPIDPSTYIAVCVMVVASAALASYIPARRAARMNPMAILAVE